MPEYVAHIVYIDILCKLHYYLTLLCTYTKLKTVLFRSSFDND